MIILKEHEVHTLLADLSVPECHRLLSSLHDVLRLYSRSKLPSSAAAGAAGEIHQPERESIVTRLGHTTLFMPCSITSATAIKVVTISAAKGLKGCVNVFAPEGELLGVVNAENVTAFRTSLAVMIPFVRWLHLRRRRRRREEQQKGQGQKRAKMANMNLVVFGAGRQAEWHVRLALLLCGDIARVTVINRSGPRKMEDLFAQLQKQYSNVSFDVLLQNNNPTYDAQLQTTLAQSDVIFCCTPSLTPLFPFRHLSSTTDDGHGNISRERERGRFISLIGSYKPSMHEVDADTLLSGAEGRIYVDTKEGCLVEAGELIDAGVEEDQLIELGELDDLEQQNVDDDSETETDTDARGNMVFKCVGLGIMDLVMARELLDMADAKGLGLRVDDF